MQLLLGHSKLESTVRYLGIEVDDALEISKQLRSDRGVQRAGHPVVDLNCADRAVQPVSQQLARSRMISWTALTLVSKGGFMAEPRTHSRGQELTVAKGSFREAHQ